MDAPDTKGFYKKIRIAAIREEVPGVKTFILEGDAVANYQAGQFITLIVWHNGIEERRSYSFSSSPGEKATITVKRVDNGLMSRYLIDEAQVGDEIETIGTAGMFTLPENINNYKQLFFFVAGVGITPIYSLIKTALIRYPHLLMTLVYSNSNIESTVFYKELRQLENEYSNLNIIWLFSNAKNLSHARLSKWMMPGLLRKNSIALREETLYYLCGPYPYMRMVTWSLEEYNILPGQIKKEFFDTKTPVFKAIPADKALHQVTLLTPDGQYQYPTQYPDTILSAARKAGITLPYSCNTGKCGTCIAKCLTGTVWHSYNEVLTDADLEKGLILTCTSYPIGGDIIISKT